MLEVLRQARGGGAGGLEGTESMEARRAVFSALTERDVLKAMGELQAPNRDLALLEHRDTFLVRFSRKVNLPLGRFFSKKWTGGKVREMARGGAGFQLHLRYRSVPAQIIRLFASNLQQSLGKRRLTV